MKTYEVPANGMMRLPKRLFKPAEKVAVFIDRSSLTIKKLEASPLSSLAERVKARPMPMREIVREVRAYRRAKYGR